jgi:hypothetical protein
MVVSLYVCDIPQNIEKEELESVFACFDGFVEVRLAKDKNRYLLYANMIGKKLLLLIITPKNKPNMQ